MSTNQSNTSEPVVLEVFSDYVCPWCYLGENRVKKVAEKHNVTIKRVHFPLHPETPSEGRTLQDMFQAGPEVIAEKNARMQGMMKAEGLPYVDRTHTYNSRLAQEVGTWADTQAEGGAGIHDAFFHAYFVDKRNIGDPEVILDVVGKCGLDVEEARKVIEERTFKDAVDADWAKSGQYGVTGVPTFVAGGRGVVGAQPVEVLEQLLAAASAEQV